MKVVLELRDLDDVLRIDLWLGILKSYAVMNDIATFDFALLGRLQNQLRAWIDEHTCTTCGEDSALWRNGPCSRCYQRERRKRIHAS